VSNNKQLCGSLPDALTAGSTTVKADGTSLGQPCTGARKPVLDDRAAVGGAGSADNPAGSPSGSKLSSEWDNCQRHPQRSSWVCWHGSVGNTTACPCSHVHVATAADGLLGMLCSQSDSQRCSKQQHCGQVLKGALTCCMRLLLCACRPGKRAAGCWRGRRRAGRRGSRHHVFPSQEASAPAGRRGWPARPGESAGLCHCLEAEEARGRGPTDGCCCPKWVWWLAPCLAACLPAARVVHAAACRWPARSCCLDLSTHNWRCRLDCTRAGAFAAGAVPAPSSPRVRAVVFTDGAGGELADEDDRQRLRAANIQVRVCCACCVRLLLLLRSRARQDKVHALGHAHAAAHTHSHRPPLS
jgi:hypothetical protein